MKNVPVWVQTPSDRVRAAVLSGPKPIASENEEKVRQALAMLPHFTVFDDIESRVEGAKVILSGRVTNPVLRSRAEVAARRNEGFSEVENRIEILPNSLSDERIRIETFRAIYSRPEFLRYAMLSVPPVHLIVKDGTITLEGVVASAKDRELAGVLASQIAGVDLVMNHLEVQTD